MQEIGIQTNVGAPQASRVLIEWLSLPDCERAELLNGRIVYKAMATIEQGDTIGGIWAQIDRFRGRLLTGGGWWLSLEAKLYLLDEGVQPDMVGWRIDKHPRPPRKVNVGTKHLGVYVTPPDWVCEVLSPSTSYRDRGVKWDAYHRAGVEHYSLVDVAHEMVTVYRRNERTYERVKEVGREDTAVLPPFEGFEFSGRRVFLLAAAIHEEEAGSKPED